MLPVSQPSALWPGDWVPHSGSLSLSPSSSLLKLPFSAPPLSEPNAIFWRAGLTSRARGNSLSTNVTHPGFPILPPHGIIFLCPLEPGWLCDMLWSKQCEPKTVSHSLLSTYRKSQHIHSVDIPFYLASPPSKGHFLLFQTMLRKVVLSTDQLE